MNETVIFVYIVDIVCTRQHHRDHHGWKSKYGLNLYSPFVFLTKANPKVMSRYQALFDFVKTTTTCEVAILCSGVDGKECKSF